MPRHRKPRAKRNKNKDKSIPVRKDTRDIGNQQQKTHQKREGDKEFLFLATLRELEPEGKIKQERSGINKKGNPYGEKI